MLPDKLVNFFLNLPTLPEKKSDILTEIAMNLQFNFRKSDTQE